MARERGDAKRACSSEMSLEDNARGKITEHGIRHYVREEWALSLPRHCSVGIPKYQGSGNVATMSYLECPRMEIKAYMQLITSTISDKERRVT